MGKTYAICSDDDFRDMKNKRDKRLKMSLIAKERHERRQLNQQMCKRNGNEKYQ